MAQYKCSVCSLELDVKYKRTFIAHIKEHEDLYQIIWPLKCGQFNCSKSFNNIKPYGAHLAHHATDIRKEEDLNYKTNNSRSVHNSRSSLNNDIPNAYDDSCNYSIDIEATEEEKEINVDYLNSSIRTEIKNKAFKLINHF